VIRPRFVNNAVAKNCLTTPEFPHYTQASAMLSIQLDVTFRCQNVDCYGKTETHLLLAQGFILQRYGPIMQARTVPQ
jgi:hypothetical protein